ncbi:Major facilitator superfamily MFS_1 [uncultured Paludibacter sp.]|uniref:Major facilitator superfamily MFS_1 n=1 Tax=uncultured Paludibacter sp. TaxID=497635 RepID=A0A653A5R0_9BACT|nr:Major facilitator superfamily MFS_1 [uncultured Paludibacter sp.]
MGSTLKEKMTNYRWVITAMLFFATTVNYMDRQVLSLTWKDFISPEFHWTNNDYGNITGLFSIFYAIGLLFAGKFIDWMDTKKGYLWSIGIWSLGAVIHAFCGIATAWFISGDLIMSFSGAREAIALTSDISKIVTVSVSLFVFARFVLAIGEAGNFPAAIKTTAEYFPKKDRAFSTSIFNSGATVGALLAPVSIPFIAKAWGWEMAFIVIGALGFIWMGFWIFIYDKPEKSNKVNQAELEYINQDDISYNVQNEIVIKKNISYAKALKYKQTWAFAFGKFMTDGVWWFYLFWTPAYLSSVYGLDSTQSAPQIFVLYLITMLSIIGGWLPTYFVDKKGMNPYGGRMKAMLIFAFFPLLALLAQPLGYISVWIPVIIIGIAGAAHQAWSANIFSTIGDMFPKYAVATITGIGGMAGGIGSYLINKGSGVLFDFAENTQMKLFGFKGIESGYFIIFSICSVAYIIGWVIMKWLVPKYRPITDL